MKKLTAEKCRELLKELQNTKARGAGLTESAIGYLQALEIALPILEQQERGEGGWIEWGGGGCPVNGSDWIEARLRNGKEAGGIGLLADWEHENRCDDIIAYRIIPEQPTNQNGEQ